jgi:hypothetical protein
LSLLWHARLCGRRVHAWLLSTGLPDTGQLHALPLQILLLTTRRRCTVLRSALLLACRWLTALLSTAWRQWRAAGLPRQAVRPLRSRAGLRLG